jgi:hypothetical protein
VDTVAPGADQMLARLDGLPAAEAERRLLECCASGRDVEELLAVLRSRLGNDPETEREVVRAELAKITGLRLAKLLS